jgi:succinate dehydrogenase / fumarate reductase flavoprotein subunit/fumarate reductase (CoM/CoB) subunit A
VKQVPTNDPMRTETDVLVIGSGAAGMYAAIEAARAGHRVLLADRSLFGRGGATVMAQMTVAVALGAETPDDWQHHYADTLTAGRGLCNPDLARLLCEQGPDCIRAMDEWGVGWARKDGHITQAMAPGHDRPRCVYVDFLNTGPAVSKTLRTVVNKTPGITRAGDICITDLVSGDGGVAGAAGMHLGSGAPVVISAKATIIATGGLTRLYRRNSASVNMGGDGYALALRAGATLVDMEFVQFFPIGHLAPRLIGMDPIMWDPFRYKLGGRLINNRGEEFTRTYGVAEDGQYRITRDAGSFAILKEVEAGRGSPHGGVFLSFRHVPEAQLRAAFGPVIDKLAENGIDLTRTDVEVAPIAHYHMGGIAADATMRTGLPGLFAAGEAVGGANGANRLSGNAVTEALVFGREAGRQAADYVRGIASAPEGDARAALDLLGASASRPINTAAMVERLQATMQDDVGPLRDATTLTRALGTIDELTEELGDAPAGGTGGFDMQRLDWFDLRNMLMVARAVAQASLARKESRGAQQREDHPQMSPEWNVNQFITLKDGRLHVERGAALPMAAAS